MRNRIFIIIKVNKKDIPEDIVNIYHKIRNELKNFVGTK